MIEDESQIGFMYDSLIKSDIVGIDTEWRPQLCKFHSTRPALF